MFSTGAGITVGTGAAGLQFSATGGSASSGTGGGGSVTIAAAGTLSIPFGTYGTALPIYVSPLGTNGQGGSINLSGSTLSVTGAGALALSANGKGTGNGGSIYVGTTGAAGSITLGTANGNISTLSATGGTASGSCVKPCELCFRQ